MTEVIARRTAEGLPELCYSRLGEGDSCVIIRRGVAGYYATNWPPGFTDAQVDEMNARLGVTKAQRLAMEIGSLAGWHVPGADPRMHEARFASLDA